MCARYASDLTMDDWAKLYDLAMEGPPLWNFQANYNVAITETIPVVMLRDGKRVLERMRWWLIPWFHKGTIKEWKRATYNTRSDNVDAATWRGIWQKNRCPHPGVGILRAVPHARRQEGHRRSPTTSRRLTAPLRWPSRASSIAGKDPENDGRDYSPAR